MTRCKAFYRKMKKLRGDDEATSKFCQKENRTIEGIYDHIDFMDKHFPNWLDDDPKCVDKSSGCTIVRKPPSELSEGATRALRKIQRKNPEALDKIVEELSKTKGPQIEREVKRIVQKHNPPKPLQYANMTVEKYGALWKGNPMSSVSTHEEHYQHLLGVQQYSREKWHDNLRLYRSQIVKGSLTDVMIWYIADYILAYLRLYEDYEELLNEREAVQRIRKEAGLDAQ